jgi:hypothetical protein
MLYFPMQRYTKVRELLNASTTNFLFYEAYFDDGGDGEEDHDDEDANIA